VAPISLVSTEPSAESAPLGELELLQAEIDADHAQLAQLEADAHAAGAELAEIAGRAANLKIELSAGSPSATAALDALESRQRTAERRHEGLRLRISTLHAGLAPKLRHATEVAMLRDAQRQDQIVSDLTATSEARLAELLHHWRAACGIGFDLMQELDRAMGGNLALDPEHRRQILVLNTGIGAKLLAASCEQANAQWAFARVDSFHQLRVIPGKPRNEIARAG
jgi:hypothetical protein